MINSEIRIGTENKWVPYEVKVGIACTAILFEGVGKSSWPVLKTVSGHALERWDKRQRSLKAGLRIGLKRFQYVK